MEKHFWLVMVLAMVAMFAFACGDDDSSGGSDADTDADSDADTDTDSDADGTLTLTAATADGPCGPGSIYFISELSPSTFQQVSLVSGATDSLGRITGLPLKSNTPYEMWVQCYDFNEITGNLSESQVTLFSFLVTGDGVSDPDAGPIPEQPGNITDVSHILSTRVKSAYIAGAEHTHAAYESIKDTAFQSLIAQMSFLVAPTDISDCDVNELTIVDGPSSCNDTALAIELVIRNFAVKTAETEGQPQTAFLQNTLNGLKFAFEDGTLSTGSPNANDLIAKISDSVPTLDVLTAVINLANYLTPLGGTSPNADTVLNMDGDDIPNSLDPDIDGDTILNEDDEAPYNAKVGAGMFLDSDNGLAWQINSDPWENDPVAYCASFGLGGYSGYWRLPTISELRLIIDDCDLTETGGTCGITDTSSTSDDFNIDCQGCGVSADCYLLIPDSENCAGNQSSNEVAGMDPGTYWSVNFQTAAVFYQNPDNTRIRCVRTM